MAEAPKDELIAGHVTASDPTATIVELDRAVELMGHSGSPIISQATRQVIGTLSRGGDVDGKSTLILAPSHAIFRAMRDAEAAGDRPKLQDTVGKK